MPTKSHLLAFIHGPLYHSYGSLWHKSDLQWLALPWRPHDYCSESTLFRRFDLVTPFVWNDEPDLDRGHPVSGKILPHPDLSVQSLEFGPTALGAGHICLEMSSSQRLGEVTAFPCVSLACWLGALVIELILLVHEPRALAKGIPPLVHLGSLDYQCPRRFFQGSGQQL